MLCTPVVLPRAETAQLRQQAVWSSVPPSHTFDDDLEELKARVGEVKAAQGDDIWADMVNQAESGTVVAKRLAEPPPSRAYYKMIEIIRTCAIQAADMSLHLCEAPGGFAQATLDETNVRRVFVTSLDKDGAPRFATSLVQNKKAVCVLRLPSKADIFDAGVRDLLLASVPGAFDLVTADGAFNNDNHPELTEAASVPLILCEIDVALRAQAIGGAFVLKVFGLSLQPTLEAIALLTRSYEVVSIVKPTGSRAVNDERYIVCQGFSGRGSWTRFPLLPAKPNADDAFLRSFASVSASWVQEVSELIASLRAVQGRAIRAALTSTARGAKPGVCPRQGRRPWKQKRGREKEYDRRSSLVCTAIRDSPQDSTKI